MIFIVHPTRWRSITSLFRGSLKQDYNFLNIIFRWERNNIDGSENIIISSKFINVPKQKIYYKMLETDILGCSFFNSMHNTYLDFGFIICFKYVNFLLTCLCIELIVLSLLVLDFSRNYFTCIGRFKIPLFSERVRWIQKTDWVVIISSRLVRKFRKLCGCSRIESKRTISRPILKLNGRTFWP